MVGDESTQTVKIFRRNGTVLIWRRVSMFTWDTIGRILSFYIGAAKRTIQYSEGDLVVHNDRDVIDGEV